MTTALYQTERTRAFSRVVVNVAIVVGLDAIAIMASTTCYPVSIVANATFLGWTGIAGYSLLKSTEVTMRYHSMPRAVSIAQAVPAIVLLAVCYASIWTGWVFWVDPQTVLYHRGPLHFVQVVLAFGYLVACVALVLRGLVRTSLAQRQRELRAMLLSFALPVVGSILGIAFYGIPFTWTLCTVAVLMVFVNFQEYSISTDSLTGLSNRRQLDAYVSSRMEDPEERATTTLLLMDINHFKAINDTFGHRVGDEALTETAGILKRAVGNRHVLISRYGGDEFAVVGALDSIEDALDLKNTIVEAFEERNRLVETPYNLMLSIGVARIGGGICSFDDLVREADKMLYAEKAARGLRC